MNTYKITPGTVLKYFCRFDKKWIVEVFSNYCGGNLYQMESCSVYSSADISQMIVLTGSVVNTRFEESEKEYLNPDYKAAKYYAGVVNEYGPYLSECGDEIRKEYYEARANIARLGYGMNCGELFKK